MENPIQEFCFKELFMYICHWRKTYKSYDNRTAKTKKLPIIPKEAQ